MAQIITPHCTIVNYFITDVAINAPLLIE